MILDAAPSDSRSRVEIDGVEVVLAPDEVNSEEREADCGMIPVVQLNSTGEGFAFTIVAHPRFSAFVLNPEDMTADLQTTDRNRWLLGKADLEKAAHKSRAKRLIVLVGSFVLCVVAHPGLDIQGLALLPPHLLAFGTMGHGVSISHDPFDPLLLCVPPRAEDFVDCSVWGNSESSVF